jgi:hypothetical protein
MLGLALLTYRVSATLQEVNAQRPIAGYAKLNPTYRPTDL